jgi:transaldolase
MGPRLVRAADLFRSVHDRTGGVDGWVSLEVSPLLAKDTANTVRSAAGLHDRSQRPNLFIEIPGTPEGVVAIEESIFGGVPINVTLLFSAAQYIAAAEAYMRGIERRIAAGLDPRIESVASIFVSRWDVAVHDTVPAELRPRSAGGSRHHRYDSRKDARRLRRSRQGRGGAAP